MWAVVLSTPDSAAEDLATRLLAGTPRLGTTRLLSIDGRAGAGKTGLAERVAQALDAPLVHLDDLYPGWDGLAAGVQHLREGVLEPLRHGRPGAYRRWDWHRSTPAELRQVPVSAALVIEGVGASVASAGLTTLSVWIEASPTVRRARALARDGDMFTPHWETWAAQEETLLAGIMASPASAGPTGAGPTGADVVIDNNEESA